MGLKRDTGTECFLGILKADNMVNFFLSLILTLLTRSLNKKIFRFSKEVHMLLQYRCHM